MAQKVRFIEPKKPVQVKWEISDQTKCIVEYYAKFTDYPEQEVADKFLKNLLGDKEFIAYLKSQRRTTRMIDRMFNGDETMSVLKDYSDDGYAIVREATLYDDKGAVPPGE